MENTNNYGQVLGALLLGGAIGGALGILFAPDKGSVTRKKIRTGGEDMKDAFNEKLNEILDQAKAEVNEMVEKSEKMFERNLDHTGHSKQA